MHHDDGVGRPHRDRSPSPPGDDQRRRDGVSSAHHTRNAKGCLWACASTSHDCAITIADRGDDRRLPREPPRGDAHSGGRYGGGKGYGQPDNMYGKGGYGRGDFYGGGGKGYGGPSPGYYEGGGCARRERSNHLLLRAFGVGCFCAACDPADG